MLKLIFSVIYKNKNFTQSSMILFTSDWIYIGVLCDMWLRHCATSRKVAGSILDGVIGYFSLT